MRLAMMLLLVPFAAALATEPPNVRGITLGQTQEAVLSAAQDAQCSNSTAGLTECTFNGYGPDPRAIVLIELVDDRVYMAYSYFDGSHFETVRAGMTQKFGPPAVEQEHILQNAAGATFPSKKLMWSGGSGATLVLTQRDGRIDRSSVRLADLTGVRAANARRAADPKAAENL